MFDVSVARPVLGKRNLIVKTDELEKRILIAEKDRANAGGILVVLDADDDCPVEIASDLLVRAQAATDLPVKVVTAVREYEAWFLGAIPSLRGRRGIAEDAPEHPAPEQPRDAKAAITERMVRGRRYVEVADQPALSEAFDLDASAARCASLNKFMRDVLSLAVVI